MSDDNTHNEGDRVYFDDNPGTVINGGPAYYEIEWHNGHVSWESEHDLMSEAEWLKSCEEFE